MGRPERPVNASLNTYHAFAHDLRQLRVNAGAPPYRVLAAQAHYSKATLARAASGHGLPSLDVTLAYVRACGGDPEQWERRWHELAATGAQGPHGETTHKPLPAVTSTTTDHEVTRRPRRPTAIRRRRSRTAAIALLLAVLGAAAVLFGRSHHNTPPILATPAGGPMIVGIQAACCTQMTGTWTAVPHGGAPGYWGPIVKTTDSQATITWRWTVADPAGTGSVRIRVWIPDTGAGAWVRYQVTTTGHTPRDFTMAQQPTQGWYGLPATFPVDSSPQHLASIKITMSFVRAYTGPAADSGCPLGLCYAMAAGQVEITVLPPAQRPRS